MEYHQEASSVTQKSLQVLNVFKNAVQYLAELLEDKHCRNLLALGICWFRDLDWRSNKNSVSMMKTSKFGKCLL